MEQKPHHLGVEGDLLGQTDAVADLKHNGDAKVRLSTSIHIHPSILLAHHQIECMKTPLKIRVETLQVSPAGRSCNNSIFGSKCSGAIVLNNTWLIF